MKSPRFALLASLLLPLATACGARSSLTLAESSGASSGGGAKGVCVGIALACVTPPPPTCLSATTLQAWISPGTCAEGTCSYSGVDVACQAGCVGDMCAGMITADAVSAGAVFTCAITSMGAVKCWGDNDGGELGNNTTNDSPVPVDVVGLTSGVLHIAPGHGGGCALTSVGALKCWGSNVFGQLGNNTTADSNLPVDVVGLASSVVAVESGDLHTCAVLSTGALQCWGWNVTGNLGNNSTTNSPFPVSVVGF